jgi:hypothetical protein
LRKSWVLMATTSVLSDIKTAPITGERNIQNGASQRLPGKACKAIPGVLVSCMHGLPPFGSRPCAAKSL